MKYIIFAVIAVLFGRAAWKRLRPMMQSKDTAIVDPSILEPAGKLAHNFADTFNGAREWLVTTLGNPWADLLIWILILLFVWQLVIFILRLFGKSSATNSGSWINLTVVAVVAIVIMGFAYTVPRTAAVIKDLGTPEDVTFTFKNPADGSHSNVEQVSLNQRFLVVMPMGTGLSACTRITGSDRRHLVQGAGEKNQFRFERFTEQTKAWLLSLNLTKPQLYYELRRPKRLGEDPC